MSTKMCEIVLVGKTGEGKSCLGNRLLGKNCFAESDDPDSETMKTIGETGKFDKQPIYVIDTPGINDSNGMDAQHVVEMVNFIKSRKTLQGVGFVLNFQNPRFEDTMKRTFRLFWNIFPNANFWQHITLIFTRCYDVMVKEEQKEKVRTKYCAKVAEVIQNMSTSQQIPRISCYFVDSPNMDDAKTKGEISNMIGWLASLKPLCECGEVKQPDTKWLKVEWEQRERVLQETNDVDIQEKEVANMVPVEKPTMVEVHYQGRGFLGTGLFSSSHTKTEQRGTHLELEQQGMKKEKFVAGKINKVTMVQEKREKRTHYDGKTVSYGDWIEIRRYTQ